VEAQYDFAEYFMFPGTLERRTKYYRDQASGGSYTYQGMGIVTRETIDGEEYYFEGYYYYRITPQGVLLIGYKGPTGIVRYDPPTLLGSRNMSAGDVYTVFYEPSPGSGSRVYREDTFLGTEDVTTTAGFFPGCLKMRVKVHGSSLTTFIRYFAQGIGKVKEEYLESGSYSSSTELVSARIGTTVIPSGVVYYSGSGTWTQDTIPPPRRTGTFTFRYSHGEPPYWGRLILVGFQVSPFPGETPSDRSLLVKSDDGVHFTDWQPVAGYVPTVAMTAENGVIGGTGGTVSLTGTYAVE
jgi:hypothetical protein